MCDVYEVEVEEPVAYLARFAAGAKYAMSLDRVRHYVELATTKNLKASEIVWEALAKMSTEERAYVYAYCRLRGLRNALILAGRGSVVAFDLPEGRLGEVAGEIRDYYMTVASAMLKYSEGKDLGELLGRDENWDLLERCKSLDAGVDVEACLARAREILEKAKAGRR